MQVPCLPPIYRSKQPFVMPWERVLAGGWYQAREVARFEGDFAGFCGSAYATGVASDALILALKVFDIVWRW